MGTPAKPKQAEYPIYKMEEKGKLILPPEVISQITYLHSHCGSKEWSGLLLYDVKNGNPSKPENFELEVKHIFLMDIGSAGATNYELDGDIVELYDEIPEAMEQKLGHVHTHHSGSAYFSGVDEGELQDNVDKYNYYLSLVVNFNGLYAAKVAFLSDMHTTSKMNFINDAGVTKHFKQSKVEKHMVIIDMKIYYATLGGFFSDRLEAVVKKINDAEKAYAAKPKAGFQYGGYGGGSRQWNPLTQRMEEISANNELPHHPINSKIIPDKMTSWEVEKLTRNILMFDAELKTESNVYGVLHQIVKEQAGNESETDLYFDFLLNNIDNVLDAYFDIPLDDDERIIVMKEVIMSVKRFEAMALLQDLIFHLEETFIHFMSGYDPAIIVIDEPTENRGEETIAEQLAAMEKELP